MAGKAADRINAEFFWCRVAVARSAGTLIIPAVALVAWVVAGFEFFF